MIPFGIIKRDSLILKPPYWRDHECFPSTPQGQETKCFKCKDWLFKARAYKKCLEEEEITTHDDCAKKYTYLDWCYHCSEEKVISKVLKFYQPKSKRSLPFTVMLLREIRAAEEAIHHQRVRKWKCSNCVTLMCHESRNCENCLCAIEIMKRKTRLIKENLRRLNPPGNKSPVDNAQ